MRKFLTPVPIDENYSGFNFLEAAVKYGNPTTWLSSPEGRAKRTAEAGAINAKAELDSALAQSIMAQANKSNAGMSTGAKIGIGVGILAIGIGVFIYFKRRK